MRFCIFLKIAENRPKTSPKSLQDDPRTPQDPPRQAQDDPGRPQDGPKTAPRRPQDGPRTAPRRPQDLPRPPRSLRRPRKTPRTSPRTPQDPPRTPQDPPKTPPGPPKTSPGPPRDPSRTPPGTDFRAISNQFELDLVSSWPLPRPPRISSKKVFPSRTRPRTTKDQPTNFNLGWRDSRSDYNIAYSIATVVLTPSFANNASMRVHDLYSVQSALACAPLG